MFLLYVALFLQALKKSQKEASILVQRSCRAKETDPPHGHMNPIKGSKLETELTDQWRLLFRSMADILAHESNQLVSLTLVAYFFGFIFLPMYLNSMMVTLPVIVPLIFQEISC